MRRDVGISLFFLENAPEHVFIKQSRLHASNLTFDTTVKILQGCTCLSIALAKSQLIHIINMAIEIMNWSKLLLGMA
jgi:glutathione synthase/RimK-type ligase-like ATP-grasp enzyme